MRYAAVAAHRLRDAGFEVCSLAGRDPEESRDLARQCVRARVETLVVCGGDGMVHLALQALACTTVNLGVVPAGTGNDFARSLGIPRNDPAGAADVVVASRVRTVDLARVGRRYFATVLAAGFDSLVNERADEMSWPAGRLRYTVATLAELRVFQPLPFVLELDGQVLHRPAMLVAVGNGPSYGGGLRITHGAQIDDGLLDVVVINRMSPLELVRTYPRLLTGAHVSHPAYEHHRVRSVTVDSPGVTAYADGERLGRLPLRVDVAPGALRVLAPAMMSG
jgi:diacylglycerol kinase (ATP)